MDYVVMCYDDRTLQEELFRGTKEECEKFISSMNSGEPNPYDLFKLNIDDPFPGVMRWSTYLGDIILCSEEIEEQCLNWLQDKEADDYNLEESENKEWEDNEC